MTIGGASGRHLMAAIALLLVSLHAALGACVVNEKTSVALLVPGGQPIVPVEVNGIQATFVLDTGAARSMVSTAAVQRLGLTRDQWVGTTLSGVGGYSAIERRPNALPRSLTLGGVPLVRPTLNHDTSFAVGDLRVVAPGAPIDGLLGRDFLSVFDLDLDMPGQRVTLYQPSGCAGWFLPWTGNYTSVPISIPAVRAIVVSAAVDGVPLRALLDSGASSSLIGRPGIVRMGIDLATLSGDPGDEVGGVGPRTVTMRRHQFRSLQVGGQLIDHPLIWVAPIRLYPIVDMLLGDDWLATRRVWISYATQQLFVAAPP